MLGLLGADGQQPRVGLDLVLGDHGPAEVGVEGRVPLDVSVGGQRERRRPIARPRGDRVGQGSAHPAAGLVDYEYIDKRVENLGLTGPPGSSRKMFLRARANSIEGGTSEIQRNIIGERVLGLPGEPRTDKEQAWKDVPRS